MSADIRVTVGATDADLTQAVALSPLGGYVLGLVTAGGQGVTCFLSDRECDHLEVAAHAHKAVLEIVEP